MKKQFSSLVLLLLIIGISYNAHTSIVYVSDNRFIDNSLSSSGPVTPSPAFSDFNSSLVVGASGSVQNTVLTGSSMSGSGSAYTPGMSGAVTSNFAVTFSVDELTNFSLSGTIETHWFLASSVGVSLQVNGIPTNYFSFTDSDVSNMGVSPFSFDGQFSPDKTYTLDLWANGSETGDFDVEWNFNLTTTPVPIPASAWLFVSGLMGLFGMKRLSRR